MRTATLNQIHATNMSKLTGKNTNETSKNKTLLPLQLTLNTYHLNILFSRKMCHNCTD